MKQFALGTDTPTSILSPGPDDGLYEGLADAEIEIATASKDGLTALVTFLLPDGTRTSRRVAGMRYLVGRYSSLDFLEPPLMKEIGVDPGTQVRAATLRDKVEDDGLEITKGLFAIGSLTGDSLVKFGLGGGVWVAGRVTAKMRESGVGSGVSQETLTPSETPQLVDKLVGVENPPSSLPSPSKAKSRAKGCVLS